jgi:nucleotide-binding universal stress UspA family protein
MIRTIMVALDASERAPAVLAAAATLAERFEARLLLFRAIAVPPEFPPAAHVDGGDRLESVLAAQARKELEALAQGHPRAEVDHPVIARGQPWRAIVSAAERHDADLVVIGSHGYHGLDRVLGTTAARVADHCRRDVYIVHVRGRGAPEEAS